MLPAQLYLMNSFDMGRLNDSRMGTDMEARFQKYDEETGNFTPARIKTTLKRPSSGTAVNLGRADQNTQNCAAIDFEDPCKK